MTGAASRTPLPWKLRLKPWNWTELMRPGLRALNRVTKAHQRKIDQTTSALMHNSFFFPHGFFPDGFGRYELCEQYTRQIADAHHCRPPVTKIDPIIMPMETAEGGIKIIEGAFTSTLPLPLTDLPVESREARFQLVYPEAWTSQKQKTAVVLLPATGEFKYRRRQHTMGLPLATQHGIATVILEGAFYGSRKPCQQKRSKLRAVTDLLVLGRATIEEARSLLHWLKEEMGADTLVVAGSSMGGLHAAMTGALMPSPVGVVAHMAPPSAYHAYCHGLLFNGIDKNKLTRELETQGSAESLVESMIRHLSITDISKFPPPVRSDAALVTVGTCDDYLPYDLVIDVWRSVQREWEGCQVKAIDSGHVTGILVERDVFRQGITDVVKVLQAP